MLLLGSEINCPSPLVTHSYVGIVKYPTIGLKKMVAEMELDRAVLDLEVTPPLLITH